MDAHESSPRPTLSGLVSVVTGGSSGIGRAVTRRLSADGSRCYALDLVEGDSEFWVPCDVADDDQVRHAVESVAAQSGGVDIVVNCAGVGAVGTVEDTSYDDWVRLLDINLLGAVRVVRHALPLLRASIAPAIVNVTSIAATAGIPERAAYSASKGALLALTRAMAADYVREGIRVNAVSPGTVATPWIDRLLEGADHPERVLAGLAARQPTGRLVGPAEVAAAVAFLANPECGSVTGVSLEVDGGMQQLRPARD